MPDWLIAQLPLAAAWIGYAALHSALAALPVKQAVESRWPTLAGRYRLLYNLLAAALLLPVLAISHATPGPLLWQPSGWTAALAGVAMVVGVAGFLFSTRDYDMAAFLGLAGPGAEASAVAEPPFRIGRIHRLVRHPWYASAMLIVWALPMTASWLVSAAFITLYFVIGSRHEEARMIAVYGERYRRYRARVPAFVPLPGCSLDAAEAAALERGDP